MTEKRQVDRLTSYWNLIKKDRPYPDFAQFNQDGISDIWPRCLQVKIIAPDSSSASFVYEYMGKELAVLYGEDVVGQPLQMNAKQGFPSKMAKQLRNILTAPHIIEDHGQFVSESSKIIKYRACLLPFGVEGKNLTHVVIGVSWREF